MEKSLRDSLNRVTSISQKRGNFFSLAYRFTKQISVDTLTDAADKKYPLLKLRFYSKKYPEDRDELLDLIVIRNRKGEASCIRAYIHRHCSLLDDASVDYKPLNDSTWLLESTGAGACALTLTVEQYSDTLILSDDAVKLRPWHGEPQLLTHINRMDFTE